jgi:RNA polymerase sigma factor (sigma-70 family)
MNSAQLLTRFCKTGSNEAFTELVRRHSDLVFSIAKRRLGSAALAEEIAQVVFVRLARIRPQLSSDYALLGWLHRTTLHVSIDFVRAEARRRIREEKSMESAGSDDNSRWQELTPFLDEALDRLKDEERGILLLRFFDRKPFTEVGMAYRISEDAAKMRVARALEKLRDLLAEQKVYCTAGMIRGLLLSRAVEASPIALAGRVIAVLPSFAPRPLNVILSHGGVLVATVSLLLAGSLFIFQRSARKKQELSLAAASAPESTAFKMRTASTGPAFAGRGSAGALPEKFNAITTRTVLTLLDAKTSSAIPKARVSIAYFYDGGVDEGHNLTSNAKGEAPIPFANREGDHGANYLCDGRRLCAESHKLEGVLSNELRDEAGPRVDLLGTGC